MSKQVAVIGVGAWGKNLARNFQQLDALGAVCCHDLHAQTVTEWNGVPVRAFEEVLSDDSIKGVVISTPTPAHFEQAEMALKAGKHVFVEKPLTETANDAKALCDLAAVSQKTLMVGHLLIHHTAFQKVKEIVHNGTIGSIRHIESRRCNFGKFRSYETIIRDFAPHDLSMIDALLPDVDFQWAVQPSGPVLMPHIDQAHITFTAEEASGALFFSRVWPVKEQQFIVQGTKGLIVFDDTKPWGEKVKLGLYEHIPFDGQQEPTIIMAPVVLQESEPLKDECRHFLACMEDNAGECRTPGVQGHKILEWLEELDKCHMLSEK